MKKDRKLLRWTSAYQADAVDIAILVSNISVRYRSIPFPDWVPLSRYKTGSGIGIFLVPAPNCPDDEQLPLCKRKIVFNYTCILKNNIFKFTKWWLLVFTNYK